MGSDMARVLDAGDNLRVLPMIGKGSLQNLVDILRLKNIDMGFVVGDALRVGIRLADEAIRQHEKRCIALPDCQPSGNAGRVFRVCQTIGSTRRIGVVASKFSVAAAETQ